MSTILALFRAINVGGTRKLPMADLRATCLAIGWKNPQTYINSGNLIVDAPVPEDDARTMLERELHAKLAWTPDIILRTADAWRGYVAANPFAGEGDVNPKALHLCISRLAPEGDAARVLQARANAGERVVLAGGALWVDFTVSGILGSRLTAAVIDRACGSPTTGRNWNTVLRLAAMLEERGV